MSDTVQLDLLIMVFKPKAWLFAQCIIYTNTFLSFNSGLLLFCGLVQYNNTIMSFLKSEYL